ncbi:hypothetical protein BASA81_017691 [Batrachochytrium salamandrivorans]|nr:hypothetical protein BASA81_017691 [Batrachochytrium salamandrivorans]
MDLHVIVHSEVLQKVFVLESDWPLIIADFLAGEDNMASPQQLMFTMTSDQRFSALPRISGTLKVWVDNRSDNSSFWCAVHEACIKDFISRCPQCQLNHRLREFIRLCQSDQSPQLPCPLSDGD